MLQDANYNVVAVTDAGCPYQKPHPARIQRSSTRRGGFPGRLM
jgi:hypothetical protein